jgi:hypothetical protein
MNLLLYPESVKFDREHPLDPKQFQYLEGCVRKEKPYDVPSLPRTMTGLFSIYPSAVLVLAIPIC